MDIDKIAERICGGLPSGDKTAMFSKRHRTLEYWDSRNTTTTVDCDTLDRAKAIIKKSGVKQKLKKIAYTDMIADKLAKEFSKFAKPDDVVLTFRNAKTMQGVMEFLDDHFNGKPPSYSMDDGWFGKSVRLIGHSSNQKLVQESLKLLKKRRLKFTVDVVPGERKASIVDRVAASFIGADPKALLKDLKSIEIRTAEGDNKTGLPTIEGKKFSSVDDFEKALRKFEKPDQGYSKCHMIIKFKDGSELTKFRFDYGHRDPSFGKQLELYIKKNVKVD